MKELGITDYNAIEWRLYIDSSKQRLKCILLHNRNLIDTIPICHSVCLREKYKNIKRVIDLLQYHMNKWIIWVGLKLVRYFLVQKRGYTKYPCIFMHVGQQSSWEAMQSDWPPGSDIVDPNILRRQKEHYISTSAYKTCLLLLKIYQLFQVPHLYIFQPVFWKNSVFDGPDRFHSSLKMTISSEKSKNAWLAHSKPLSKIFLEILEQRIPPKLCSKYWKASKFSLHHSIFCIAILRTARKILVQPVMNKVSDSTNIWRSSRQVIWVDGSHPIGWLLLEY